MRIKHTVADRDKREQGALAKRAKVPGDLSGMFGRDVELVRLRVELSCELAKFFLGKQVE
jgi:hypothetical protein